MKNDDPAYRALRRKAEQIAAEETAGLTDEEQLELLRLAHELEIAHVDLATQNEQLQDLARELEASRNEFFDLYESAPVAFVTLSPKGLITRMNEAARRLLLAAAGRVAGFAFSLCVAPEDRGIYFRRLREIASENKGSTFELRLIAPNDGHRFVHIQVAPKFDPARAFSHWNLAFFDSTEQKQLEDEIRTSREHLALATRSGGVGIWNYDLSTRKTYWNEQLYRLLGLVPREGPEDGDAFFGYIHPEDRKGVLHNTQSVVEGGDNLDLEFRIVRADDGEVRWLASKGRIDRDENGKPVRIQGVNFDITDRKRSEIALEESRVLLRSVLEHSMDVPFRRNLQEGRYEYISPVIEELVDYSQEEVRRMTYGELLDLIHPEDRNRVAAVLEEGGKAGKGKLEFRLRKNGGGYIWVADYFTIQKDADGRPLYRTGVLRDISESKKTERTLEDQKRQLTDQLCELERINRELSEYTYAVSHDLKAPLRAVRNYADFLAEDLDGQIGEEQKTYLEGIKKAGAQGDRLIRDLLNLSRIGESAVSLEQVDLNGLVREVRESVVLPKKAKVSVQSGCSPLYTDRTLVKQILANLIENGVKFNESATPEVEVLCRPGSDDRIEVVVNDNGIGIEDRYREQVFRVFQRLHPASAYDGTGIGLAIVRKAAAALGGTVHLESTPGKGSTFIVTLPTNSFQEHRAPETTDEPS